MRGAITIVFAVLLLAGCEDGSYFDPNTKQIKSDFVSRIEADGTDMRVYEFTPQSNPGKQCVFVAATSKGGLVCFDQ